MDALVRALEFPSSVLLAVSFLLTAFALHHYHRGNLVVKALSSIRAAWILLAIGAVLLAVEGTWSIRLHRSFLFLLYALTLLLSLAFTLLNGIRKKAKMGFMLNHSGIFLIVWAALFGAPDVSRSKIIIAQDQTEKVAYTEDGKAVPLPFDISLEQFFIDYYPDGASPRQFTSRLIVDGKKMSVSVNHPKSCQGYTFFQESYDRKNGRYTVMQLVRDPWLPITYCGMVLLAVGSLLLLFGKWHSPRVFLLALLLTLVFSALTVAKINFGTLMPALRSWWFVPHLFIYMVAYALMALTLFFWIVGTIGKRPHWQFLCYNLVRASSALLIIGMLIGSVWARQAWGDYWAWDSKENWAAVTWFVTLMFLHFRNNGGWRGFALLVVAFLALQITWYGVNYLPAAADSLHTYNN